MTNCILHQLFTCIDRISGSEVIKQFRSVDGFGCRWPFGSLWTKWDSLDSSIDDFSDTDSETNFPLMIPQDYLGLAFFSMLCCFWPLGIAAFYLSQKTNKASAQGDFQGANAASRQALWLSVLSIVFGIITYICAIAALISYLSGKPP
uniref:Transmembrane protein 91 n=1 Tax=Sphaeramia orbicularis TaxID=375764 RepID=A0A673BIC1_9TELE